MIKKRQPHAPPLLYDLNVLYSAKPTPGSVLLLSARRTLQICPAKVRRRHKVDHITPDRIYISGLKTTVGTTRLFYRLEPTRHRATPRKILESGLAETELSGFLKQPKVTDHNTR